MPRATDMGPDERASFLKSLDDVGEESVRNTISRNAYATTEQIALAGQWLEDRELARMERAQAPALRVAKSANTAAWVAVGLAIISLLVAGVSLVIAVRAGGG